MFMTMIQRLDTLYIEVNQSEKTLEEISQALRDRQNSEEWSVTGEDKIFDTLHAREKQARDSVKRGREQIMEALQPYVVQSGKEEYRKGNDTLLPLQLVEGHKGKEATLNMISHLS